MGDIAVVKDLSMLRAVILLATRELERVLFKTDKPAFQKKHGLDPKHMEILEKGDFDEVEGTIINVQTTPTSPVALTSPLAPISPLEPTS